MIKQRFAIDLDSVKKVLKAFPFNNMYYKEMQLGLTHIYVLTHLETRVFADLTYAIDAITKMLEENDEDLSNYSLDRHTYNYEFKEFIYAENIDLEQYIDIGGEDEVAAGLSDISDIDSDSDNGI